VADEYTPTTDEVREAWADHQTGIASRRQMHRDDFNQWLDQRDQAIRERIAQDIEAEAEYEEVYGCRAMHEAARIARGETR
jgi:hypothetical protein